MYPERWEQEYGDCGAVMESVAVLAPIIFSALTMRKITPVEHRMDSNY
jgi:hypothetical protein